jgi:RNA polymerase sigma-70 factor (ECF subfamily)
MGCMGENDQATVRAILGGDKEAYGRLVALHSRSVFRVAYRITANEADAEEVVQEAFLRGYRKLETFESRANFGTWIYRIAVRCALDKVAGRRGGETVPLSETNDSESETVQVADCGPDPERMALSNEIGAIRKLAMRTLTPVEQTAFTLRHMEGCSIDEIAGVLEIAPNAAKQAVYRAVHKLRQRLAKLRVRT